MYKAEIYHSIDLDNSKQSHVSISGGKATHSFNRVTHLTNSDLKCLIEAVKKQFGEVYDTYENKLYLSIPESEWSEIECPENYEAYITQVSEREVILDSDLNEVT